MYNFLNIQYKLGNITKEKLLSFVGIFITQKQYETIIDEPETQQVIDEAK